MGTSVAWQDIRRDRQDITDYVIRFTSASTPPVNSLPWADFMSRA